MTFNSNDYEVLPITEEQVRNLPRAIATEEDERTLTEQQFADVPDPYRHCTTCKHHKPKEHPFGLCKKGLHQADDERCQEYRQKNLTGKPIIDTETL